MAAFFYSLGAVASTILGGWLVLWKKEIARRHLWRILAFGSGTLLGITFLHLMPEAWEMDPRWAGGAALSAFIFFYVLEQFTMVHACSEILGEEHFHSLGTRALASLSLHSAADGLAIAFSFLQSEPLGTLVAFAVIVHKFCDGLTLSSLFRGAGYSESKTNRWVLAQASATPAGVLLGLAGKSLISPSFLAALLGLAAGSFLYVSTADILPRLHKSKDTLCWVFLLTGVAVSALLGRH